MSGTGAADPLVRRFIDLATIEGRSGREQSVARAVVNQLEEAGLTVETQAPPEGGGQGNLICPIAGGGGTILTAHLDTARSTAGLAPQVGRERITSDGTSVLGVDNRAGVAVLVQLAVEAATGRIQAEPFTVVFTVREESDLAGSRTMALRESWQRAYVFDSSLRPGRYIHGSYGAKRFDVRIEGRAAHAGIAPETGADAIRAAALAITRMPLGRLDSETTANVGRVEGGLAINTVPDRAWFEGEVRALREARVDQVVEEIRQRSEEAAADLGATAVMEHAWDFRPFRIDPDSAVCRHLERAIHGAGLTPEPVFSSGGSDANWLNARGLPALNVGIGAQNPHSNDEFILIEDLRASLRIARGLVAP